MIIPPKPEIRQTLAVTVPLGIAIQKVTSRAGGFNPSEKATYTLFQGRLVQPGKVFDDRDDDSPA
jgi:hypothetical protein